MKITRRGFDLSIERKDFRFSPVRPPELGQCGECARIVQMLLPYDAAAIAGISLRELYRRIETAQVHFFESDSGDISVCMRSLFAKE